MHILMFNEGVFVRYEMPNDGKGFVQFYMDKISTDPSVFIFRIEDTFSDDFSSRFVLSVLVYDYYNPERSSMKHYMIGSGNGQASPVVCDDGGGQCKCNRVVSSDSEEIFQEPTPADALYDHKHDGECHVTEETYFKRWRIRKIETKSLRHRNVIETVPIQRSGVGINTFDDFFRMYKELVYIPA
ncbi:hypothetical protein DPMN_022707 [Dreissena polymorpha]|uniref:Alpha-macroglobulin receptor-binding domain-containing protein n=1 Tax=Dreissena polymorpha TaxID=45954 RepID=A0A9D4NQI4_DREPO|nr:hypothetical protein DPMN_022707 [Dreissena polymorpha]